MASMEQFGWDGQQSVDDYDQLLAEREALRAAQSKIDAQDKPSIEESAPEQSQTAKDDARLYGYLEELRLSDPSQAPSRSRRIGRASFRRDWGGRR